MKKKRGMLEIPIKLIYLLIFAIIVIGGIYLVLKARGISAIQYIRDIWRFGR